MNNKHGQDGFTLIAVILVVFLMTSLTLLAVRGESRVESCARDLRSLARHEEESMLSHRRRRVTPSSGRKPLDFANANVTHF